MRQVLIVTKSRVTKSLFRKNPPPIRRPQCHCRIFAVSNKMTAVFGFLLQHIQGGSQLEKIGFLTGAQIFSNWGVKTTILNYQLSILNCQLSPVNYFSYLCGRKDNEKHE